MHALALRSPEDADRLKLLPVVPRRAIFLGVEASLAPAELLPCSLPLDGPNKYVEKVYPDRSSRYRYL